MESFLTFEDFRYLDENMEYFRHAVLLKVLNNFKEIFMESFFQENLVFHFLPGS